MSPQYNTIQYTHTYTHRHTHTHTHLHTPKGETKWSYDHVTVEVRLGVVGWLGGHHQISVTALRILLIFGQKLDIDVLRKLAEPFFRKKYFE